MVYVLRKSFGAYSAGTRVSYDEETGGCYIFDTDIPAELVVRRRDMTRMVPTINSRERRRRMKAEKRALGI
jgi:hypothetical protein